MPRNGSGTYTLPAGNPVVNGTVISSSVQNTTMTDVASALTASIAVDGQTPATANLPMGGFKHINVAAASAATDYARFDQVIPTTGGTMAGNLTFSGTGRRILGDFSNGTTTNRLTFQTTTADNETTVGAIPTGTSRIASFIAHNRPDPDNASTTALTSVDGESQVVAGRTGTGSFQPLSLYTSGVQRLRIAADGQIGIADGNAFSGVRTVNLTNMDAGGGSAASFSAVSNAGSLRFQANSSGAGSLGYIASSSGMTSGLTLAAEGPNAVSFQTNSVEQLRIRSDGSLWTDGNGQPGFLARAWVNFDGTLAGPSISPRASANVLSVTKNGTGDYTITFSTNLTDANYAALVTSQPTSGGAGLTRFVSATNAAYRFVTTDTSGVALDNARNHVAFFR